jgi:glycosyltransferase involved in cell wall biosynthesis
VRVLMLTESAPSLHPSLGNGSTLITARLLRNLPSDVEVDLVYFRDRRHAPDPQALRRARTVREEPARSRWRSLAAQPMTSLPRGSWQRPEPAGLLELARTADVMYAHGLHVMHLAAASPIPVVAHEVDPWSQFWSQRAAERAGAARRYDLLQARRALRVERAVADSGATIVVVNEADADLLRRSTGGQVVAVANGVELPPEPSTEPPADPVLAFVGSLDYAPNIEAVRRLVERVWPQVRARVPAARLVVAGRRPADPVLALAGDGVEVVGEVGDVGDVFRAARASVYAGVTGRGTKNSVTESLVHGCPVVASVESARSQRPGPHLRIGADDAALAALAVALLTDEQEARAARLGCTAFRAQARTWAAFGEDITTLLRQAAATRTPA